MEENSISEDFERELSKFKDNGILSAEYIKKKRIIYFVRTAIATTLFFVFWKYQWVRWSLIIYIPLNLFSLVSIFGFNFFLKKKMKRVEKVIKEAEIKS